MAVAPLPGEPKGWWVGRESAEEFELRRWAEGVVERRARADRIGRLQAKANMYEARATAAMVRRYEAPVESLPPGWCLVWSDAEGRFVRSPPGTRYGDV